MNTKTKTALDALQALTPHERKLVMCWFCDACREEVPPGDSHRCKEGSSVWAPHEDAPPKFTLEDTGEGPVYLRFPDHPGEVERTLPLQDELAYSGRRVNLDFDTQARLIGVEVL